MLSNDDPVFRALASAVALFKSLCVFQDTVGGSESEVAEIFGEFFKGEVVEGGEFHTQVKGYIVCPQGCRDTRTVTRVRHHLLCYGTTKICVTIA